MYNWKDTRNYRRFRDENGNVIANIIYCLLYTSDAADE